MNENIHVMSSRILKEAESSTASPLWLALVGWPPENYLTSLSQVLFVMCKAEGGGDVLLPLYASWIDVLIFTQTSGSLSYVKSRMVPEQKTIKILI